MGELKMSLTKDYLFSRKANAGLGDWSSGESDESLSFLGELCNEPEYKIDIDDYLYEAYKESERMDDD